METTTQDKVENVAKKIELTEEALNPELDKVVAGNEILKETLDIWKQK